MESRFTFGHIQKTKFHHLEKKDIKDLLTKWSLQDGLKAQAFYFDGKFKIYLLDNFIRDFFGSDHVMSNLQRSTDSGRFAPINIQAEVVKFKHVKATLTSTEIFDRLMAEDSPVARSSGAIIKCIPEIVQLPSEIHNNSYSIELCDQLRKLILCDHTRDVLSYEDTSIEELYSAEEKDEFLYRLLSHLVLGGSLCQYEDNVQTYIDTAKTIYKDFMTIAKAPPLSPDDPENEDENESNNALVIKSVVVKITSIMNENYTKEDLLFTKLHVNNFMYVIIQPEDQMVFTLYHQVI